MGWQDRPYYRDPRPGAGNPLMWLLSGSVPLFTVFGIRVRAHVSLLILIVLVLLFGLGQGFTWQDRVISMSILFGIVLLHEFGHCFTARWVGGDADDILMTPLGGLAFARAPHRPLPTFLTVAGGPAVNVVICALCAVIMYVSGDGVNWNPFRFSPPGYFQGWFDLYRYTYWIFAVSWFLLLFNMLPIFPFDGGQMLQAALWPKFGYYRSMMFACITGMIGAVALAMLGLASGNFLLVFIAISGFITCYQMRQQLLAAGPYGFANEPDYSSSLYDSEKVIRRKLGKRSIKRAQKRERQDRIEQRKIDTILAKVSAHGMQSLSWWERRTLRKATERQREAEAASDKRFM